MWIARTAAATVSVVQSARATWQETHLRAEAERRVRSAGIRLADALAVTLAGGGDYVGVAPLGTAFTDAQADRLCPYLGSGRPGVIVATDADRTGQHAAARMFWLLTSRGDDPRHLVVPSGKDPPELLQSAGPAALRQALNASGSLAGALIDAHIDAHADRLHTVEGQVQTTRHAAEIIAAAPVAAWPGHLTHVVARTSIAPDIAVADVLDAHQARSGGGTTGNRVASSPVTIAEREPSSARAGPLPWRTDSGRSPWHCQRVRRQPNGAPPCAAPRPQTALILAFESRTGFAAMASSSVASERRWSARW